MHPINLSKTLSALLILYIGSIQYTFAAQKWSFESEQTKAQLVELYTSHGCSSCPPAERWMNSLAQRPDLWKRVVPVAFHVDYWDYIGWADIYASPKYGKRQRQHNLLGNVRSVYTPGFVVNGKEWTGFFTRRPLPLNAESAPILSASVLGNSLLIKFPSNKQAHIAHVALLGFGFSDDIRAGENEGETLKSEFVVLAYQHRRSRTGVWSFVIPQDTKLHNSNRLAIAAWVTDTYQRPLQATGSWAPDSWDFTTH